LAQGILMESALSGTAFDIQYIHTAVTDHARVLELVEARLLPSAMDPRYRAFLQNFRSVISNHLLEAQQISRSLPTP
jgi:predicted outer membrane protein